MAQSESRACHSRGPSRLDIQIARALNFAGPVDVDVLNEACQPANVVALCAERDELKSQVAALSCDLADALACVTAWRVLAEQRLLLLEHQ